MTRRLLLLVSVVVVWSGAGVTLVDAPSALAARGHVSAGAFAGPCAGPGGTCEPGQLSAPAGVAVNARSGDVYVVDQELGRVERFTAAGVFAGQFDGSGTFEANGQTEITGAAPTGGLLFPEGVATDNSCQLHSPEPLTEATKPTCHEFDESDGDVYVVDKGHTTVDKFSPTGEYIGQLTETTPGVPFGELSAVSVDTQGRVWMLQKTSPEEEVDDFGNGALNEFIAARKPAFTGNLVLPGILSVDSHDNFYAIGFSEGLQSIAKFDSGGTVISGAVGGERSSETPSRGVAVEPASNDVYVDRFNSVARFAPSGAILERFGTGVLSAGTGVGLDPMTETIYVADAATETVQRFGPEPPSTPRVESESVASVTSGSAVLGAEINPRSEGGEPETDYTFQYGVCATAAPCATSGYGSSIPASRASLAADFDVHSVIAEPQDLLAHTTYHFRLVAENSHGRSEGEERMFTTQTGSGALVLLDGRQWEQVSPANKHGALIEPIGEGHATQAALAGDALTYVAVTPTDSEPNGYANNVQVRSTRGPSGWTSKDIALSNDAPTGQSAAQEYRLFTQDLGQALVEPLGSFTPHSPLATEQTPYLRREDRCRSESATSECFLPLVTAANVPGGTQFGACQPGHNLVACGPELVGATNDLSHAVLESSVALTATALEGGNAGLYEWSQGAAADEPLKLVSVLPGAGEAAAEGTPELGFHNRVARNAISTDGSRVIWTEKEGGQHLYLRDTVKNETVQLDAVTDGTGEDSPRPTFQFASNDGSRVFFTDNQRLTADSGGGPDGVDEKEADLFECEITTANGKLGCALTDLTPLHNGEEAHVQDQVLGGSEEGCDVTSGRECDIYFVANAALTSGEGAIHGNCAGLGSVSGALCNLYVLHNGGAGWETRLVTLLSAEDFPDWNGQSGQNLLTNMTARVSPDGRWLAFMSLRPVTGYDTRDSRSGRPDEEVYLYHVDTTPSGQLEAGSLVCASCNPSGARPLGVEFKKMLFGGDGSALVWSADQGIAGSVPTWSAFEDGGVARYQPRYLSDTGRLFFNSSDALVPQDVNGIGDVYEYEPAEPPTMESDNCTASSSTFSVSKAGCVDLVSSGAASQEAVFMDASQTGDDAFVLTTAQLSAQDGDTSYDVYDAHVCTTNAPCLAATSPSEPNECTSADGCRPAAAPREGSPTPETATALGAGNVSPAKSKPPTRAQKLARALRACKVKKRRKRAACRTAAYKKYGRVKPGVSSKRRGK